MRLAALLVALMFAGQAMALSCVPQDIKRTFTQAHEAEEIFVVVHGRVSFDADLLPKTDLADQTMPQSTDIPARIEGVALTRKGFGPAFAQDITLSVLCFGPWCGGMVPDIEQLTFLQRTEAGYVLQINPCGGMAFPEPTEDMLDTVATCFRRGTCPE